MDITMRTEFPETVLWILQQQGIIKQRAQCTQKGYDLHIALEDDSQYRNVSSWTGDAIGCGLLLGYKIERP